MKKILSAYSAYIVLVLILALYIPQFLTQDHTVPLTSEETNPTPLPEPNPEPAPVRNETTPEGHKIYYVYSGLNIVVQPKLSGHYRNHRKYVVYTYTQYIQSKLFEFLDVLNDIQEDTQKAILLILALLAIPPLLVGLSKVPKPFLQQ